MFNRGQAGHLFIYVMLILMIFFFTLGYAIMDDIITGENLAGLAHDNQTAATNLMDNTITPSWHAVAFIFLLAIPIIAIFSGYASQT